MSASSTSFSGFLADIAADVGNSYQDVLLQDSPLQNRLKDIELPEGEPATATPLVGLTGDIIPPEGPAGLDSLEAHWVVDTNYTEVQEPPAISGPLPALPAPDMDGPELDGR